MAGMTDQPKALTTRQVAAKLGITRQTVIAWARQGLIPHWVLLNGHLRYDPDTIDQLRDEQLAARAS